MPDFDLLLGIIQQTVGQSPDALAVTIASKQSPWASLVSTVLSLRTRDEVTRVAAPKLLAKAPTPKLMFELSEQDIQNLIYPTSFYRMKSKTLRSIAADIIDRFNGEVPSTIDELLTLNGIGRKSANLIVTLGFNKPGICIDSHLFRICERLGWTENSKNPEETEFTLRKTLPEKHWIPINGQLIAFGRSICTPISPKCSQCPVEKSCAKRGVSVSR